MSEEVLVNYSFSLFSVWITLRYFLEIQKMPRNTGCPWRRFLRSGGSDSSDGEAWGSEKLKVAPWCPMVMYGEF